jgi:hypothetical protein
MEFQGSDVGNYRSMFKDDTIMRTRLLSIAIVVVFSLSAQAQLPSEKYSPLNYFGRFAGFGHSEGYHACNTERSNSWTFFKPLDSMSSTLGPATAPPSRQPLVRSTIVPNQGVPAYMPVQAPMHQELMQMQTPLQMQSIHPPVQAAPPSMQWNAFPQATYEPVPPASNPLPSPLPSPTQASPSDNRNPQPTPTPKIELLPAPLTPSTLPGVKVPKVSRSLVEPPAYMPRS